MLQPASSQFIGRPCIFHHCMYSASFTSTSPLLCRDSGASALCAAGSILLVKYLKCKKHKKKWNQVIFCDNRFMCGRVYIMIFHWLVRCVCLKFKWQCRYTAVTFIINDGNVIFIAVRRQTCIPVNLHEIAPWGNRTN